MLTIPVGSSNTPTSFVTGGVALDPLTSGQTAVSVSASGLITQPQGTVTVTVSAPGISVNTYTVAAGLQTGASGSLGATNHGGVTVHIASSDPSTLLLSPNATTAGTSSIDIFLADGYSSFSYTVQGVEGHTGTPTVTVSAPGFVDGSNTVSVVPTAVSLGGLNSTTTASSANDDFYAQVGYQYGNTVWSQNVRAGGPSITLTFTSTSPAVGTLVTSTETGGSVTLTIPAGAANTPTSFANGGVTLDPLTAGQTTVSVSGSGLITQPLGTVTVTVNP